MRRCTARRAEGSPPYKTQFIWYGKRGVEDAAPYEAYRKSVQAGE
ncbi:MAG: hypothetical protein PUC06_10795 [Oscillospiraceae bacterium]|nr:hypothetical protein [Oscillospiraceae bacterium]